jgi:hypothetical protein
MSFMFKVQISDKFCIKVTNFSENRYRSMNALKLEKCFSCFRWNEVDCLLIKFEPMEKFNFEEQFYVFKIIEFLYVNSISVQLWCEINVEEWYFILFLSNGDIE